MGMNKPIKHKTHHYVVADGVYLGGFGDGATPPDGAIKVPLAPKHGKDVWDGVKWVDYTPTPQPAPDINAAIRALIAGDTVAAQAAMDKME